MRKSNISRYGVLLALALMVGIGSIGATEADTKVKADKKLTEIKEPVKAVKDTIAAVADSLNVPAASQHQVVAYYFHSNVRCVSCRKIEAYTKAAIDSAFGDALKSGQLQWHVVNTDSAQNEHFLKDYELFTKSVVLSDRHNGTQTRWKNLDKVWELLGDQPKFQAYIQDEVRSFLDPTK